MEAGSPEQSYKEKFEDSEKRLSKSDAQLKSTEQKLAAAKSENELLKYVSDKVYLCAIILVVTAISFWILADRVLSCQLNQFQAVVISITVISWCVLIAILLSLFNKRDD